MYFFHSRLNLLVMLIMSAQLNACTTQSYYAPVITDNKEITKDKQNPLINKQGLDKDNGVITRDMRQYPVEKNRRPFLNMDVSSGYGYQQSAPWPQKWPTHTFRVEEKIKFFNPDPENELTYKKRQKSATKNVDIRQVNVLVSENKSNSEDSSGDEKHQIKLDGTKSKKKQQQKGKANVLVDNQKILEPNFGWPIKGRILKSFSPSRNKGIDIAGRNGQSVKATEAGKVVYGGQGLIGFGKLLIIKHNDVYLSAYANNTRLLVNEGQYVQKGQVIAEVGEVGIKRTSLHFEIRKHGKPVDPLELLPDK